MTHQMLRGLMGNVFPTGTQEQTTVGDNVPLISDEKGKSKKKKRCPIKSNILNTGCSNSTIPYTSLQQQILPDIQPNNNTLDPTSMNPFLSQATVQQTSSLSNPHEYIMDVFDRLLLPNLHLSQGSSSVDAIRKCLYRRFYSELAMKELRAITHEIGTVEDLIPIILNVCTKAGLVLI